MRFRILCFNWSTTLGPWCHRFTAHSKFRSSYFHGSYFHNSRPICKECEIFHHAKISHYTMKHTHIQRPLQAIYTQWNTYCISLTSEMPQNMYTWVTMAPETYHINSISQCCGLIATVHVHVQYVIVLATCSMHCGPLARRVMVSWLHLNCEPLGQWFIYRSGTSLPAGSGTSPPTLGAAFRFWDQPSGSGTNLPALGPLEP